MYEDIRTWFFDCDGVILDSNAAKTEAFRVVAAPYGGEAAEALVHHHVSNGGVSRWAKLEFLFDSILQRPPKPGELDGLLEQFGDHSRRALVKADQDAAAVPLLHHLRERGDRIFVVSGGRQDEVRAELERRDLADLLDGVFGSPRDKQDIVEDILSDDLDSNRAMFVGDGLRDWETAQALGLGFTFVRHWSEWRGWMTASNDSWVVVEDLDELLEAVQYPASTAVGSTDA